MRKLIITAEEQGSRLDRYLFKYFDAVSAAFVYKHLRKKNIKLNGRKAAGNEKLKAGDEIALYFSDLSLEGLSRFAKIKGDENPYTGSSSLNPGAACNLVKPIAANDAGGMSRCCNIIYEDGRIIIADKKAGVLSQKARPSDMSLNEALLDYVKREEKGGVKSAENSSGLSVYTPSICNRLDMNTSGLIIFAKTYAAAREINRVIKERSIEKYYLALVEGRVSEEKHICSWLIKDGLSNKVTITDKYADGASRIETCYEPLKYIVDTYGKDGGSSGRSSVITLLKVRLITGKTHQIRAQLAAAGYPVAGDTKYGCKPRGRSVNARRQMLHAWRLVMPSDLGAPLENMAGMVFTAPLPRDMAGIIGDIKP